MKNNSFKSLTSFLAMVAIFGIFVPSLPISNLTFAQQSSKGVDLPTVNELPSKEKRWALIVGVDKYEKDVSRRCS